MNTINKLKRRKIISQEYQHWVHRPTGSDEKNEMKNEMKKIQYNSKIINLEALALQEVVYLVPDLGGHGHLGVS